MEERVALDADQQESLTKEAAAIDEEILRVQDELGSAAQPAYEQALEQLKVMKEVSERVGGWVGGWVRE